MTQSASQASWIEAKRDIIVLVNKSRQNYILELPTGRYRLDAGRKMRTMRSILDIQQVKQLVDGGQIAVEKA